MSVLYIAIDFIISLLVSNAYFIIIRGQLPSALNTAVIVIAFLVFPVINVFPGIYRSLKLRFKTLAGGRDLLAAFLLTSAADITLFVIYLIEKFSNGVEDFWTEILPDIPNPIIAFIVCTILFWNAIIRIYATSRQLSITLKIVSAILGFIFIPVGIVFLFMVLVKVSKELKTETEYEKREKEREHLKLCATKNPILLVHGVFFRDSNLLNYWGRIPETLTRNGAVVSYGNQQSAQSVVKSAEELFEKIKSYAEKSETGKINIIAHSKGGLDSRYAISALGADKYVASLTTVNTPHRGCVFVEYLFGKISEKARAEMADVYNSTLRRLGDTNPDFIAAVTDLQEHRCREFNENTPDCENVFYQSIGSYSNGSSSGRFPLNISYPLVKKNDGQNDGLVAVTSMEWGNNFRLVEPKGPRGITHADMIDLNRENIQGFDVREFYVGVVNGLKEKGF